MNLEVLLSSNSGKYQAEFMLILLCLVEFSSKTIWAWRVIWGEFLHYEFNFLNNEKIKRRRVPHYSQVGVKV